MVPAKDKLEVAQEIQPCLGRAVGDLGVTTVAFAFEFERAKSENTVGVIDRRINLAPDVLGMNVDPPFQQSEPQ